MWSLASAFDIKHGDVVSFVGGGGKTSTMFRLAKELAARGWRVITTTTTHIGREQSSLAPCHIVLGDEPVDFEEEFSRNNLILVSGPLTENGQRWGSIPAELWDRVLQEWIGKQTADVVLVEADGAKCLPFKAPAPHEPVVPQATTLLVPVVGLDAVGARVRDTAFRPERVCSLTGLGMEDHLTPDAIAAVMAHPDGGLKGCPPAARVCVLANKADTEQRVQAARQIARRLLYSVNGAGKISRVITGTITGPNPVVVVHRPVAAVVLAAGQSLRMKSEVPKQLLPWKGKTVVRQVVETLSGLDLDPIVVVVGHRSEQVAAEFKATRARMVLNPDYKTHEMLSSAKTGIRNLDERTGACLIVLGDQPWIEPAVIEKLLSAYAAAPCGLVAPTFQGRRGNPVLIDRQYWPDLLALADDRAPRHLLEQYAGDLLLVPVETDSVLMDIDTWEDYKRAVERS